MTLWTNLWRLGTALLLVTMSAPAPFRTEPCGRPFREKAVPTLLTHLRWRVALAYPVVDRPLRHKEGDGDLFGICARLIHLDSPFPSLLLGHNAAPFFLQIELCSMKPRRTHCPLWLNCSASSLLTGVPSNISPLGVTMLITSAPTVSVRICTAPDWT